MMSDLSRQIWWTEADESELDLLVHELVKAVHAHREACSTCKVGSPWCAPLGDALQAVVDWRRGRVLRSKAAWLRARQMAVEERAA
jgi:hypothetical protein